VVLEKDLLSGKGVDQINLFKLVKYLQESKLARKVESYAIQVEAEATKPSASTKKGSFQTKTESSSSTPVLHHISSLLSALTHPSKEGRLFYSKSLDVSTPELITLKFLLLDPSTHFQEVVSDARAVILAGGTMSPMSDYTSHLFPYLASSSITTLSCGHVIPKENLIAWNLSKGPSGQELEFTFKNRANNGMVDDLGLALLNICSIVPDGVVVFFPSYNYLAEILKRWSFLIPGNTQTILQRLEIKKAIFQESKELSVDTILQGYSQAIDKGKGGLLLSVVGGKMSEGMNIMSAEWKAKIEYVESATTSRLEAEACKTKEDIYRLAKESGREFYENACMRAVNQSVGRAIRHKGDYASIIMIDKRFESERVRGKLPGWIREGLVPDTGSKNFGALMGGLSAFFRGKRA
jgi:chromosome transmission fidelity protein 1